MENNKCHTFFGGYDYTKKHSKVYNVAFHHHIKKVTSFVLLLHSKNREWFGLDGKIRFDMGLILLLWEKCVHITHIRVPAKTTPDLI